MKTAAELELTNEEYAALLSTREKLAAGTIPMDGEAPEDAPLVFNMAEYCYTNNDPEYHCGSALCIGGFMKLEMMKVEPTKTGKFNITKAHEKAIRMYVMESKEGQPINDLFFPPEYYDFDEITPSQAVKAIDNFLETGYPGWANIVESELENA